MIRVIPHDVEYTSGQLFSYLLASDLHIGSKIFDRKLLDKDFRETADKNGFIFINGDWGEFITHGDKRWTPGGSDCHSDNELWENIDRGFEILRPYVNNIIGIGTGNHEEFMQKRSTLDPTSALLSQLNKERDKNLPPIAHAGYRGFVNFRYRHKSGGAVKSFKMYYMHGVGSGTGVNTLHKMYDQVEADLYTTAHSHASLIEPRRNKIVLSSNNKVSAAERTGIITGAYVKSFSEIEKSACHEIDFGDKMTRNQTPGGVVMTQKIGKSIETKFTV